MPEVGKVPVRFPVFEAQELVVKFVGHMPGARSKPVGAEPDPESWLRNDYVLPHSTRKRIRSHPIQIFPRSRLPPFEILAFATHLASHKLSAFPWGLG